jgi:hypothetical protein
MNDASVHCAYTEYVQEKFFKTGVYTHLFIDMKEASDLENLQMKWTFTFQDLGSTHIISRSNIILCVDPSSGHICVDGVSYPDLEHAEKAIFQGQYADYVRDLYEFEGIQTA